MPKAVQPWEGVKKVQTFGPVCPIPDQTNVGPDEVVFPHRFWIQNENCQYLNVWTQSLTPAVKKPVMVWMHGGGFTNGSAIESYAYDGRTLLLRQRIVGHLLLHVQLQHGQRVHRLRRAREAQLLAVEDALH